MKKLYTITLSFLLILNLATAQVPQGFKYQTAIRDNNGAVIANKLVSIKLSLLTGSANGTTVYSEIHKVATNDFGVANLNVGNGTVSSGNFSTMDWGSNTFFLKTEVDINNGTNFTFMGSSQLLSVPFALYAAKSANASDDKDKDSTNELQTITLNNNNLQLNKNGGNVDLTKYDKDSQQLVLNGNILSITKGNSIVLSGAVDLDADPINEIQNLSLSKDTLKLSKANFVVLPKDNDADSTNEIQSLTYRNDSLYLSKSNFVKFNKDNDKDSLNELQTISRRNDTLFLSKGNFTVLPKANSVPSGSIITIGNFDSTLLNNGYSYLGRQIVNYQPYLSDTSTWQWDDCLNSINTPSSRNSHSSVWTGTEIIIWGGIKEDGGATDEGWKYNPTSKVWSAISTLNAPSARYSHSAIWTGTEMIIWGGSISGTGATNTGFKYNPLTDSWSSITNLTNAPDARMNHTAVWTGTEMIIWGGSPISVTIQGARYNPFTNNWTSNLTTTGAPLMRYNHSAIWTGTEMIIFGGENLNTTLSNGARYNPILDVWNLNLSTINSPSSRKGHSAVWTGTEMIIWGGYQSGRGFLDDYYIYLPYSNKWELSINSNNRPTRRAYFTANWFNNKMLIFGGSSDRTSFDCLGRYFQKKSPSHGDLFNLIRYDFIKN